MRTRELTLDALAAYVCRHMERSQTRLDEHYQRIVSRALESLSQSGVSVILQNEAGQKRTHDAAFASYFSTRGWAKPVLEELTLELKMVLDEDLPTERTWWQRVRRFWRTESAPKQRVVQVSCPGRGYGEGTILIDGHVFRTFTLGQDKTC